MTENIKDKKYCEMVYCIICKTKTVHMFSKDEKQKWCKECDELSQVEEERNK